MSFENFPYSNFHDMNLDWIINQWLEMKKSFTTYEQAFKDLKEFVDGYFNNLDVQKEINKKLDSMASDGTLSNLIAPFINNNSLPIMVDSIEKMINNEKIYVLSTNGHIYYYNGTAFYDSGLVYGEYPTGTYVDAGNNFLFASTYENVLPDANAPKFNSYYVYFSSNDVATGKFTKNLPNIGKLTGLLFSTKTISDYSGCLQLFYDFNNYNIYARQNTGSNNWNEWKIIANETPTGTYVDAGNNFLFASTYENVLPDANAPKFNSYYVYFSSNDVATGKFTKNLPNIGKLTGLLFSTKTISDYSGCLQLFYDFNNYNIYARQNTGSNNWNEWKLFNSENKIIHVGNGYEYNSFSKALINTYENGGNATIIVHNKNYNIVEEFKEIFGNDYWNTFSRNSKYYTGLPIGNGIKIIGDKGANIIFNNPIPDNVLIDTDFSIIKTQNNNNYIENKIIGLTFTANKIHYILHVELNGEKIDYNIEIKDCTFNIDNSQIDGSWNRAVAIGCGASLYSNYIIANNTINCVFPVTPATRASIVFHDASGNGDCYCSVVGNVSNGTIRAQSFGEKIGKCLVNIHGNKFGYPMDLIKDNVVINEWNNTIG